jgi:hypothetical protein
VNDEICVGGTPGATGMHGLYNNDVGRILRPGIVIGPA